MDIIRTSEGDLILIMERCTTHPYTVLKMIQKLGDTHTLDDRVQYTQDYSFYFMDKVM